MAKGMSLEEFKAALSSDATVENEKEVGSRNNRVKREK